MNKVGIGTRTLNFLADTLLIFILAYITYKIRNWYVFYYGVKYFVFGWYFGGWLIVYYFFFESIFARTPGKFLSYSKVVDAAGNKPSLVQVCIKNLIEAYFDRYVLPAFFRKNIARLF